MTDYQPKHLKRYNNRMGHCCFAGCTPMGCPGRCCVAEFGHRADCPLNPGRQMDEAHHEIYVRNGMRKHLFTTKGVTYDLDPNRRRRLCSCGDIAWHGGGCGISGCQNRPA